jgi:hypothetical protein
MKFHALYFCVSILSAQAFISSNKVNRIQDVSFQMRRHARPSIHDDNQQMQILLSATSNFLTTQPKPWLATLSLANNNDNRCVSKLAFMATLFLLLQSPLTMLSQPAFASNYASMSDEQKVVAEAWRLVDNSFLDRTFNGQDWFQLRQEYVKQKYKSPEDAHDAIETMVSKLGDKYTRYLSPSKYQSLVDTATGTLAGVGIEITVNKETGQIIANDLQENSPALKAGIQPGDVFVEVDGYRFIED